MSNYSNNNPSAYLNLHSVEETEKEVLNYQDHLVLEAQLGGAQHELWAEQYEQDMAAEEAMNWWPQVVEHHLLRPF